VRLYGCGLVPRFQRWEAIATAKKSKNIIYGVVRLSLVLRCLKHKEIALFCSEKSINAYQIKF